GVNKSTCVLYVPKGRIWIYWDTEPWSDFNRFSEIPAATGDVNGDGKVNVSDVTVLINMILGIVPMNQSVADVNGDGKVNVSDVTALINMILA
ncbi:MAG: dockerin type I repeat-containing protein, partial [Muribaculaceae bacterium]|nr:dockerin type I repeat-containing protein [Muribaculaceae bacterium]